MWFWNFIRHHFLYVIWGLFVGLPGIGLGWIKEHHPEFLPPVVSWIIIPGYVVYVASSFYLLLASIHHMDEDPLITCWEALKRGCGNLRMLLRFIPIVGSLFDPEKDKIHHDPDDH